MYLFFVHLQLEKEVADNTAATFSTHLSFH